MLRSLRTPKIQLLVIFVALLLVAAPPAGGLGLLPNLLAAVLPAVLIDGVWMAIESRRLRIPTSALLSGLIIFFILSTNESWLVVAWTSCFAILSKRIVRTSREHIFNPAALALVWAPIAFGSGESWWGGLADLSWAWIALLLVAGAFTVDRLNKFPLVLTFLACYFGFFTLASLVPLVLTFLACYFGFFTLASLVNPQSVAEMFREPFLQAALFLAFFMLTDPPTSPNRYGDQVWYGLLAALGAGAAQLLGASQVYLLVGLLGANTVLAIVRYARRRDSTSLVASAVST